MSDSQTDTVFMTAALELAEQAESQGEVPVGAVLVKHGVIIGRGYNQTITNNDPSAHAEIIALRDAGLKQANYRLPDTTLYITLEPCVMCAGALIHARIARVVYAATDPKTGADGSMFELLQSPLHNHRIEVQQGVLAGQSVELLQRFFQQRRAATRAAKGEPTKHAP